MKSNPFRLLLFDEVEKAHPSILDKFLQILEDGRMTDGRGETVHFSEALIVFTSNAGIYTIDYETGRPLVDPKTLKPLLRVDPRTQPTYDEVRTRLTEGVREHFQHLVQRPELLNRIGRNIVVFDIVRPEVMRLILEKVLGAVRELARTRWGVALDLAPALVDRLHALASQDVESGGRGVGNLVEAAVLNPSLGSSSGSTAASRGFGADASPHVARREGGLRPRIRGRLSVVLAHVVLMYSKRFRRTKST